MGTAGGIKTTTVALLFLDVKSVVTGKNATEAFKRRINRDNIKNALAVMTMAISILMIAVIALTFTETGSLTNICYEAFSAIGTVGLSMNSCRQANNNRFNVFWKSRTYNNSNSIGEKTKNRPAHKGLT